MCIKSTRKKKFLKFIKIRNPKKGHVRTWLMNYYFCLDGRFVGCYC